jgi:membrane fusion protein (multidrug efflux system)
VLEEKPDAAGKPGLVATQRFVRLGERRGDLVAVESGLKEGDVVVSSGAFKLRSGASVLVRNELAPKVELAPRPAEN